jgi:hypothetical protein
MFSFLCVLCIFTFSLFNDTGHSSYYVPVASSDRTVVNNELERMWKEGVVASFNALS